MLQDFASAKVNLTLEVLGKRKDGYHLLRSLVAFSSVGDRITFEPGDRFSLTISGPFGEQLDGSNLIEQAGHYVASRAPNLLPGHFHLEKNLPIASGIGGGSADAAAAIRLMSLAVSEPLEKFDITDLAHELGADIPVCLQQRPVIMEGIGEVLKPIAEMPELPVVLVNPGIEVSTGLIFKLLNAVVFEEDLEDTVAPVFLTVDDVIQYMRLHPNDLQGAAMSLAPVISDVINVLEGHERCLIARMSGSGATCFGIFNNQGNAREAASKLSRQYPEWWIEAGVLKQPV